MRAKILRLLLEHKALNGRQICRLLNGKGKDEYPWCYFSFKEKPLGKTGISCRNVVEKKCRFDYSSQVFPQLGRMHLFSRKMRFLDKGGVGWDIFRFWAITEDDFEETILAQTLIPYLKDGVGGTVN